MARQAVNEVVLDVLRDHIRGGALPRGLILQAWSVAEAFGVGRTPVAMALEKLEADGLIRKRRGHGYEIAAADEAVQPLALPLDEAGLVVPSELSAALHSRKKLKASIYPRVQAEIAALLVFGRFRVNHSALAEHYGVSRTVAQEVLTALESDSFVRRESTGRWYAGPLTFEGVRDNYEIRWLLEPQALRQAAPLLGEQELEDKLEQVRRAQAMAAPPPEVLNAVETALHNDIVLRCANERMRAILLVCQLPVIVSYRTVLRDRRDPRMRSGVPETLLEHREILTLLLTRRTEQAALSLEQHIKHGLELSSPHLRDLPELDPERIPSYLTLE